ncbi:MAG: UvrD-helicase domain-containing protein [Candidatus Micrarchaeaceae archaeon]
MFDLDAEVRFEQSPQREWSSYQLEIFTASAQSAQSAKNLMVQAVAGSGKSTTLEELSNRLGDSMLLAFNKAIAGDLKDRGLNARTFNSLGWQLWRDNRPGVTLDAQKSRKLLEEMIGKSQVFWDFGTDVCRLVSLMKSSAFGIGSSVHVSEVEDLIEAYGLDIPPDRRIELSTLAVQLFTRSVSCETTYDYDDQLYIPIHRNWAYPTYSNLLVDEYQDLNPIQDLIIKRMHKDGSRIIGVGDRWQSIYGFRGAMTDSMDRAILDLDMLELPLSISYRCSRMVVDEAKLLCPHIEARPNAPDGDVHRLELDPAEWRPDHMILCRNNAPLFRAILKELRAGRPCRVLSNFLDNIEKFVKKHSKGITSIEDFRKRLDKWYEVEVANLDAKGVPRRSGKRAGLLDRYDTYIALCERNQTVGNLLQTVTELTKGKTGPLFSTIHKAKGLESEHVHLLRPDLLPAFWADGESALTQERNLHYVAVTRAKLEFAYGERATV